MSQCKHAYNLQDGDYYERSYAILLLQCQSNNATHGFTWFQYQACERGWSGTWMRCRGHYHFQDGLSNSFCNCTTNICGTICSTRSQNTIGDSQGGRGLYSFVCATTIRCLFGMLFPNCCRDRSVACHVHYGECYGGQYSSAFVTYYFQQGYDLINGTRREDHYVYMFNYCSRGDRTIGVIFYY